MTFDPIAVMRDPEVAALPPAVQRVYRALLAATARRGSRVLSPAAFDRVLLDVSREADDTRALRAALVAAGLVVLGLDYEVLTPDLRDGARAFAEGAP